MTLHPTPSAFELERTALDQLLFGLSAANEELAASNAAAERSALLREVAGLLRSGRLQVADANDAGALLLRDTVLEVA